MQHPKTRRDFLSAGSLGFLGLTLRDYLAAAPAKAKAREKAPPKSAQPPAPVEPRKPAAPAKTESPAPKPEAAPAAKAAAPAKPGEFVLRLSASAVDLSRSSGIDDRTR